MVHRSAERVRQDTKHADHTAHHKSHQSQTTNRHQGLRYTKQNKIHLIMHMQCKRSGQTQTGHFRLPDTNNMHQAPDQAHSPETQITYRDFIE